MSTATHIDNSYIVSLVEQAHAGNTDAMRKLALCYRDGRDGVAVDLDEALYWYNTAGDGGGLYGVGCDYYNGCPAGAPGRDADKAAWAWAKAAGLGYHRAMVRLAWCHQHGVGVERDAPRAVSLYNAAVGKYRWHSWRLGACYLRGDGVERDWARAVELLRQSAEDGVDAEAYLGWCYLWGCGVGRDVARAVGLLRCGAEAWSARSMVFLGYCHERGVGVDMDADKARALYTEQSTEERAEVLGELGEYCQRGDCGAPTDKRAAVGYFQMGAEGGDPVSMFHLGVCLRDGDGVDCDAEQSHHWLAMATKLGHRGAAQILSGISSSSSVSNNGNDSAVQQQDVIIVETLKKEVESLKEQLLEERAHSEEQVISLKKQLAELRKEKEDERTAAENLREHLTEEVERYKTIVSTMTSLISATVGDFGVEKLLGTGSNAAVFKVRYQTTTSASTKTTNMVMKIIFNWEKTPQQTLLRRKYMAECVVLSLVPNHPNVIHPLGALVIPCLPAPFADKIPREQSVFRELCHNKSLAVLMPHCGITLSSFLLSLSSNHPVTVGVAEKLFVQGLRAIHHIESHFIVHRDIKEDNILVDPETGKLTLIDFGEAQHCPNMEMMVYTNTNTWANTGTIPPELSTFLKRVTRGTSGVFSYSKCDSFALALTFYDALLPHENKFIGSIMNGDMSTFNTHKLLREVKQHNNVGVENAAALLVHSVMIRMMDPDKGARLSATDAISELTQQSTTTNKL
ncbi:sel1 repeat family protein [Pelomyxa schiedti]|nr:sel1 repeat family protein [Pelomyxa schiedti]